MLQKKFQIIISALFFLAILAVPVFWMVPGTIVVERSLIEGRNLHKFPELPELADIKNAFSFLANGQSDEAREVLFNQFIDRGFQLKAEEAASDQFPFRIPFIQAAQAVDRVMIRTAYLFLSDPAIPADAHSDPLVMRDDSYMMDPPAIFNRSTKVNVDARVENYKDLIKQNPGVNFYVFYHETLPYSPLHPMNDYFTSSDHGQTLQYFEELKPDGLILTRMLFDSSDDYLKYYYRTDHHWNIHGTWKAYEEIYKMIAPRYPQMSSMLKLNGFKTFPGVMFYGSWARGRSYPIAPDEFEIADVDLPPYKIYNRAGDLIEYNQKALYEAGVYRTEPYVNHYGNYYGLNRDLVEFVYENNATRNLLVIGSSFTTPLAPLIAAHYQHTYRIDLRFYPKFSLKQFMEKHDIDDVLVIGDAEAISDPGWMIAP